MTEETKLKSILFSNKTRWTFVIIAVLILILDQWTKFEIVQRFEYGERLPITNYFDITRLHNFGAAFSFLSEAGGWQKIFFVTLGSAVTIGILVWLFKFAKKGEKLLATALSLIMAGAIGNVIDRVNYGYVVDFLLFQFDILKQALPSIFPTGHYPAFNVADISICIGAFLLIIDWIREVRREKQLAKENASKSVNLEEGQA